jgi:hypothetical protein
MMRFRPTSTHVYLLTTTGFRGFPPHSALAVKGAYFAAFACFDCGEKIPENVEACPRCGWTR